MGILLLLGDLNGPLPLFVLSASLLVSGLLLLSSWARSTNRLMNLGSLAIALGFVVWYAYPASLAHFRWLFEPSAPIATPDRRAALIALLNIAIFAAAAQSALLLARVRKPGHYNFATGRTNSLAILVGAVLCVLVGLLPYFLLSHQWDQIPSQILASRTVPKPWVHTSNLGNARSPFMVVAMSALVSGSCLIWIAVCDSKLSRGLRGASLIIALVGSAIVFFDTGTRTLFALAVGPVVIVMLTRAFLGSTGKALALASVVGVLAFLLLQLQVAFRSVHTRENIAEQLVTDWSTLGGTLDFYRETLYAVSFVPNEHDYFREPVIVEFLTAPIPRALWRSKPLPQVVRYYAQERWGVNIYETGGNVLPGVVGQYYMSWGWPGVMLVGFLLGLIASWLDRRTHFVEYDGNLYTTAISAMAAIWLLLSFRLLSPGFVYPVALAALVIHLTSVRPSHLWNRRRIAVSRQAVSH